jgi:hypothetical protein
MSAAIPPTKPSSGQPKPAANISAAGAAAATLWQALKQICCADPANARRIVMVSESDFDRAVRLARELDEPPAGPIL